MLLSAISSVTAYKDEKDQFEQRLTLSEFVKRKNDRRELIKVRIDNLDIAMEKWLAEVDNNMKSFKEKYKTRTDFNNAKIFKPLMIMVNKEAELEVKISYPEFLDKANEERHRLQLILEGQESSLEKRAQKYFRTKKPTITYLAGKFDLEENTISSFVKKIHERLKCFYFFNSTVDSMGKGDHYDDIVRFLQQSKYNTNDYFNLFMFPLAGQLIEGEICIDRKWYKLDHYETKWFLRQIHYASKDNKGDKITYYNKPGEAEYICSDPDGYEGHTAEYPYL